jgi:hypothetical protein
MRRQAAALSVVAILVAAGCSRSAPQVAPSAAPAPAPASAQRVPPFRERVGPAEDLTKPLPAAGFADRPVVARAYRIAGEIPKVLAQQPCYCACEALGHGSLLECFATGHGAG